MVKHTPGTWIAELVGTGGPRDNPMDIYEITNDHARIAEFVNACDAPILAAAPDMLDALRCAHSVLILLQKEVEGLGHSASNVPEKVRAAIARATA